MGKSKKRKLEKLPSKPYRRPSNPGHRTPTSAKSSAAAPPAPTIPFEPTSRILLIGEGDFSFSRALLEHHNCESLHATSLESRSSVLSKYPQAAAHIKILEAEEGCKVENGVDATKLGRPGNGGGSKTIRKGGWDRIAFNFPHVGGLTKDVNRQVRANQGTTFGQTYNILQLNSKGRVTCRLL